MNRIYFWLAARLPRRLMYHIINRVMIEGREIYGDSWILSLHKLGNLRSEYGAVGLFGRKRRIDRTAKT
jgi:hypothetical protein